MEKWKLKARALIANSAVYIKRKAEISGAKWKFRTKVCWIHLPKFLILSISNASLSLSLSLTFCHRTLQPLPTTQSIIQGKHECKLIHLQTHLQYKSVNSFTNPTNAF
jgi:hypothetical protein